MTDHQILADELICYLNSHYPQETEILAATDLFAAGVIDSLVIMDLMAHIEARYEIDFNPEDISPANFRTVDQLVELIHHKQLAVA